MLKTLKMLREAAGKVRGGRGKLTEVPVWSILGEIPKVTLRDCVDAYLKDPACRALVDFLADQTVGMGFYTSVDSKYAYAEKAKEAVDGFCERVNLDGLLQICAREIIAAGNSFWEKIEPDRLEDLRIIPLTSVKSIVRDQHGNVEAYVLSQDHSEKTVSPERIIHWRWNPVNGEAFGSGLLRTLLESYPTPSGARMSFLEMKARIERIMPEIFEKYAGPDEIWIFHEASEQEISTAQALLKSKPKAGARFIYSKPAEVKTVQIDPRARFEAYIEHIWNQFIIGGETPIPKLISTPGFTEASARAAVEVAERKVMALQRFMKRIVEREIFALIVEQAGYDPRKAAIRLNWGIPEKPEINIADLLKAAEQNLISPEEFRNIVRKIGWELKEPSQ